MCYAIPGRVVELKGKIAIIDYFGESRKAFNEFDDLQVGDYVYAQGGFLVKRIESNEALSILETFKEMFFKLQKVDSRISRIRGPEPKMVDEKFIKAIKKAKQGLSLTQEETLRLLRTTDSQQLKILFKTANALRQRHLKNSCCVHGIIEFSNYCKNDCYYCGIRKDNEKLERYKMSIEEIIDVVDYAVNRLGFKAIVLQSGEDFWYTTEKLIKMIKEIKARCGVFLILSVGERSIKCYEQMYKAGARGVLFRFETSNKKMYGKLHTTLKFERRIKLLEAMGKLGYLVATGSLVGLPGQTEEDLMNDILLTKSLKADMWSFGPLIPHPETPLSSSKMVNINTVLKVLAVSRLIDSKAKILVTTALETLDKENGRRLGLLSGANSLMITLTPAKYRKLYSIYPEKSGDGKEIEENIKETIALLYSLGRAPTDLGI